MIFPMSVTYASEVWNPVYKDRGENLEKVQKRFTRLINGGNTYYMETPTKTIKLDSIPFLLTWKPVRIHKDLKLMHQMYHGETKMNFDDYFEVVTDTRTRLGTIKAIKQSNSKLNIRRHSFCSRQVAR
jgi:hypothetical protein